MNILTSQYSQSSISIHKQMSPSCPVRGPDGGYSCVEQLVVPLLELGFVRAQGLQVADAFALRQGLSDGGSKTRAPRQGYRDQGYSQSLHMEKLGKNHILLTLLV